MASKAQTALAIAGCLVSLASAQEAGPKQEAGLRIVVVAGEDSVNIIDRKTAVPPVVEVRDRNDLPVAGVLVRFAIDGQGAAFQNGLRQVTITTNTVGRAAVAQLNPLTSGAVQIQVQASYQGQVATATIQQTNFATAAQAAQAGKVASQGVQSSGSSGMGAGTKAAIIGGAASAAGVGVALGAAGGDGDVPSNSPPTIDGFTTPIGTIGLQSATVMTFLPRAGDPNGDPLTYQWDLGDGTTSTETNVNHVYQTSGTFTVRLTVSDGKASASSQTTVTIKNVTGRWVGRVLCPANAAQCQAGGGQFPITIDATQNGTNVSGSTEQQVPGFPPDRCTFTNGRVDNFRIVAFAQFQGCAVLNLFQGCVGSLDPTLNNFSANSPIEFGRCELTRQ